VQYIGLPNARNFCQSLNAFKPQISTFSDGEISLSIDGFDFSHKEICIVQSLFGSNSAIIELALLLNTLSRNTSVSPHLLLTYLSYSRQDREITQTSPISSLVIAQLLATQKIQTISIVELHAPQVQGFFQQPCFNISLEDFFISHILQNFNTNEIVICAADIGGAKTSRKISTNLQCSSAIVEKMRPKAGVSHAMSLVGDVQGKICILIDDIIDSAGTLCNAADMLMQHGAKSVIAYASHGIFSGEALNRIEKSSIARIFISNTICQSNLGKIEVIDVSQFVKRQFETKIKNF
jgi:ribose-phosphate pyrophosphokinase